MEEYRCKLCGATGSYYIFRGASRDSSYLQCYRCGSTEIERYVEEVDENDLKVIRFNKPVFHDGTNCTVRYGYKWANLKIGEEILLNGDRRAIVKKLLICRFKEIKKGKIFCVNTILNAELLMVFLMCYLKYIMDFLIIV